MEATRMRKEIIKLSEAEIKHIEDCNERAQSEWRMAYTAHDRGLKQTGLQHEKRALAWEARSRLLSTGRSHFGVKL
jgi:hypothetical protein